MSRYLSEALAAHEPHFRQGIKELERLNGHPNSDIRLTALVLQLLKTKIELLGLDPSDTTAQELFEALNQKLKNDDQKLLKTIRALAAAKVNAEANIADGLKLILDQLDITEQCYALKSSVLKKQLKSLPPKKVMKHLNYRSVDSLLKHEPLGLIILAINNFEPQRYIDDFYAKYKSYKATDFESRSLTILQPKTLRWQKILSSISQTTSHQVISCYELGCLVLMPLKNELEPGQVSASLVLILNEISKILSISTYLKLHQVSASFGQKLYQLADHEPVVNASLLNRPIPWHLVQSVLSTLKSEIDVPHLSSEDLRFTRFIDKLAQIVPDFAFWQSTEFLALVKQAETTSLNILDVALNLSRKLDFSDRQTTNFKKSLWNELQASYINSQIVADSLNSESHSNQELEMAGI